MRIPHKSARGFSILETMIAMVVLSIGLVGALGALQQGAVESRLGQNRQVKMMLADAAIQRMKLQEKDSFFAGCSSGSSCGPGSCWVGTTCTPNTMPAQPTSDITAVAVGVLPWVRDPTPAGDPLDFSLGAYFNILPDGTITQVTIAGNPPCNSALLPQGTICREVYTHRDGPFGAGVGTFLPAGARSATVWVRVTRKTAPLDPAPAEVDILLNQVVIQ